MKRLVVTLTCLASLSLVAAAFNQSADTTETPPAADEPPTAPTSQSKLSLQPPAPDDKPLRIAAITTYYEDRKHADVILTKFLTGFPTDDGLIKPRVKIVSLYIDQTRQDDLGHKLAAHYGIPIFATIKDALTLGGDKLAVDGVLIVGEHGEYPANRFGMKLYPRMAMSEQVMRVMEASGRIVPIFNDKHLAASWLDAKWIFDRSKDLGVPYQAGSNLPLWWRNPALEHPLGSKITSAVALTFGEYDAYGFHGLEMLQCMLERREGGETGIKSVRGLKGKDFYAAADRGEIDMELVEAACAATGTKKPGKLKDHEDEPQAILVNYNDGTRGLVLLSYKYTGMKWAYAARENGKIVSCEFVSGGPPMAVFSYLGLNAQELFLTGKVQVPLERTLLATGALDYAHRSVAQGGKEIPTPFLDIRYPAPTTRPIKPAATATQPSGTSLMAWPPEEIRKYYPAR